MSFAENGVAQIPAVAFGSGRRYAVERREWGLTNPLDSTQSRYRSCPSFLCRVHLRGRGGGGSKVSGVAKFTRQRSLFARYVMFLTFFHKGPGFGLLRRCGGDAVGCGGCRRCGTLGPRALAARQRRALCEGGQAREIHRVTTLSSTSGMMSVRRPATRPAGRGLDRGWQQR